MNIQAIGFDADDTLWHNEDHFAATEDAFADLLSKWCDADAAKAKLLETETHNLELFGYGVKSFMLSMIEAAMELSQGEIEATDLRVLLDHGREMLLRPAELLPGVSDVLEQLCDVSPLLLVTKGDLHHQERKVAGSGIANWFRSVEVVSEKDSETYARILARHAIVPTSFVMIGNSVKSDILPIVELGGTGIHIPYSFTWGHEMVDHGTTKHIERNSESARYFEVDSFKELPGLIRRLNSR
jgi:putative hydrolase of the HAD superfamily